MSGKHAALIIENNLSASFEVSLKELRVFLSKYGRHKNIHRVAKNFGLVISKNSSQTSASLKNLTN
jgi:hypothetical protein